MKIDKQTELFTAFGREEFELFGHYINSPLFNVREQVVSIYSALIKNYESIAAQKADKEKLAAGVLKEKASAENIRKLFSDLNREFYNFLALREFSGDQNYKQLAVLRRLRTEKLNDRFKGRLREVVKSALADYESESRYQTIAEASFEEYTAEPESEFINYSASIQTRSDNLDHDFILKKLLIYQLMFSKQYINKDPLGYRWEFWEEIENFIRQNIKSIKEHHPEIYLRYIMLKMLVSKNDHYIDEYIAYLEKSEPLFSRQKASDYYSDIYNLMTIRITRGEVPFRRRMLELVKKLDGKNMLLNIEGKKISYYNFKQIADTSIYLRELDWLEHFILKYKDLLDEENTVNIVNLEFAKLYYYKNDFKKARSFQARVSYNDFIYYLDAKHLLACIEYDEENYNEVFSLADSIKKYMKSHAGVPGYAIETYTNFMSYLLEMVRLRELAGRDAGFDIKKLKQNFEAETRAVYARKWLEERIAELKA